MASCQHAVNHKHTTLVRTRGVLDQAYVPNCYRCVTMPINLAATPGQDGDEEIVKEQDIKLGSPSQAQ